jgi:hypothetical protein
MRRKRKSVQVNKHFFAAASHSADHHFGQAIHVSKILYASQDITRMTSCHQYLLKGLFWELNPGPLAPEARIMPLDQTANVYSRNR